MKKTKINISAAVLVLTALLLSSCSAGTQKDTVSMYDLRVAMCENTDFGEMTYVSSSDTDAQDNFDYLSDFSYSKVSSYFMYFASDGSKNSDEIAVVALKNASDTGEMVKSLEKHLEHRKSLYRTYGPEQLPKLENALVFSKDRYAVLIVADSPEQIRKSFENFIERK